jgi:PAS domain S-box-containing protein
MSPSSPQLAGLAVPLDGLPVAILCCERQADPAVRFTNAAFVRGFGFRAAEIPRLSDWLRHAYPIDAYRQRVLDQWQQAADLAAREGLGSLQCRVEDGRGERREVQLQLSVHGEFILAAVIDVTPHRRAEAELEEARAIRAEMALSITEAIPVGTYTMVMTPDRPVAYFQFLSERFLQITGLERARARENPLEAFACVHPDDYEEWLRLNAEAFAAKRPFRGECRVVVEGETRWITAESVPRDLDDGSTVWEGVLIDVTERVLAQRSLRASERRLQRILDNLPVPVGTMRLGEGGGEGELFQNRCFTETYGWDASALHDLDSWFALAYPDPAYRAEVRQRWERDLAEATASGGRVREGEYRVRCADGRDRDVLISGIRLDDLLVVTLLDISERRQAERLMEQKLRSSLTAAAVAHEINQPLSAILLHARLARGRPGSGGGSRPGAELAGCLDALMEEAERVVTITEKMRCLLRNVHTEARPLDLVTVAESALLYLRPRLEAGGVEVLREGLEQPAWIAGDADQLQVAVSNLVRNALEALRGSADPRRVAVAIGRGPQGVELRIGDSGAGIPEGVIAGLPLITTKPDGSGIGLFVVGTTVDNHGGVLQFGTSPLGGAEVRLAFPPLQTP